MSRWLRIGLTFVVFAILVFAASVLSASAEGNTSSFCAGKDAFVVRDQESLPDPQCGAAGSYALTSDVWGRKDFSTFAAAEEFRQGRDASYWFVPEAVATSTPAVEASAVPEVEAEATVEVESVSAEVSLTWQNFCSGISPIVLTGGGVLNIGLDDPTPPCDGQGTLVLVEPWRIGCGGEDVVHNPNCNVGLRVKFLTWAELVDWMADGNWTEGSAWFRPEGWDPLVETTAVRATPTPAVVEPDLADEVSWLQLMIKYLQARLDQLLAIAP